MSQNCDTGLGFCFIVYRRLLFEEKVKKLQKLHVFCYKIKTRTSINNLRHASLDMNVYLKCSKFGSCRTNIKRDMHVQKIKVEKSL